MFYDYIRQDDRLDKVDGFNKINIKIKNNEYFLENVKKLNHEDKMAWKNKIMRIRYGEITKDVLLMLAVAGIFAVAATSPYFLTNIARGFIKYKKYNKRHNNVNESSLVRSLTGLNKNKIIIFKREKDKFIVKLTEKGKKIVEEIQFENMKIEKQKSWDKLWRIVIFDIPERKKRIMRNAMREKLYKLGFCQLQKSVWVCPYPCEKEIRVVCDIFGINPFVNIITAEKIYNDDILLEHFKLL